MKKSNSNFWEILTGTIVVTVFSYFGFLAGKMNTINTINSIFPTKKICLEFVADTKIKNPSNLFEEDKDEIRSIRSGEVLCMNMTHTNRAEIEMSYWGVVHYNMPQYLTNK